MILPQQTNDQYFVCFYYTNNKRNNKDISLTIAVDYQKYRMNHVKQSKYEKALECGYIDMWSSGQDQ